ncbi:reverse transcriptase domain-containing protein, partial [Tanacetum coccineum]
MEPRHVRVRETTPVLHTRSLRTQRQRERVVEFEDTPDRDGSRVERNPEGVKTVNLYNRLSPPHTEVANLRLTWDGISFLTIEDYPLPDRLKMPSHVGSYAGKGDPDNYLHLFEGVIRMQKEAMPVAYHIYTGDTLQILGLHEEQRISGFVHGLRTRSLVEFLSTDLLTTYRGLMEKTYTWIEAREAALQPVQESKGDSGNREDHGHDTNHYRELRHQIEEAVKLGQLAHLARISGRQVNRVYMDNGSSCEVIYDHCFLRLKPSIRSLRVDSKTPLVGFFEEHSWPLGKVPLEITIGGKPFNTEHRLNEFNHIEQVKQKKRGLAPERNEVDGRWKLCVDFTDINKACPKDYYPLPAADQRVINLSKFRLKCFLDANKGATYQKLVEEVFNDQIGRNLEVQVDDMVIKSDSEEDMLVDIQETFDKLRAINMKLNLRKCSFSVEEGPFLGHLIMKQGIKENHLKVKAISDLQSSKMNCTNGKIVQWITEAEEAFRKIKEFIKTLPTVTVLIKGKTLVMYLAASEESISAVLLAERGKKQVPVYFVSQTLQGAELEYLELEKIVLALVYAVRRLRRGRNSIKGHILVDFLAETPSTEDKEMKAEKATDKEPEPENAWKLYTDGASSSDGSRVGLMLVIPKGKEYTYALRLEFKTTNNEAEYEALLAGLCIAAEMKIQNLVIFIDSQLVENQVKGLFEARKPMIKQYLEKTKEILKSFRSTPWST